MVDPTEWMARTCERFGMPLTVFFEVEEYLAFERERESLIESWAYDPAAEIRKQAGDLIRRGHDLQLHLHPEWVGAIFPREQWILRPEKRTVDSLYVTPEEVSKYIGDRKSVIDGLYKAAGTKKRVTAFRAGAFCAQPGKMLLRALAENGIVIDSSLVKGMVRWDEQVQLDFSGVPENRKHWTISEDVAREDSLGRVTEIPIYSLMGRRIQQLTPRRLLAKFSGNVPKDKQREMVKQLGIGRTPMSALRFLRQRFPIKLDFHNMSAAQMLRWIRQAPSAPEGDLDVIVLIGHSKEHRDDGNFERFLEGVAADLSLEVVSMGDVAEMLLAKGSDRERSNDSREHNELPYSDPWSFVG